MTVIKSSGEASTVAAPSMLKDTYSASAPGHPKTVTGELSMDSSWVTGLRVNLAGVPDDSR